MGGLIQYTRHSLTAKGEYKTKPVVANVVEVLEEVEWEEEGTSELMGEIESDDDEDYFNSLPVADISTSSGYVE